MKIFLFILPPGQTNVQYGDGNFANKNRRGYTTAVSRTKIKRDVKLIELSLVLTGGLGLLLTLQAGADVMLALLDFSDNALLGAAPLETAQCGLQRLVLLDANFHVCFPSLRWHPAKSRMRSGPATQA